MHLANETLMGEHQTKQNPEHSLRLIFFFFINAIALSKNSSKREEKKNEYRVEILIGRSFHIFIKVASHYTIEF